MESRRKLRRDDFKPGMIVRAPCHEEDFEDGKGSDVPPPMPGADIAASSMKDAKSHISMSNYGAVHSKLRYLIVLARFKQHYVAIPVYT